VIARPGDRLLHRLRGRIGRLKFAPRTEADISSDEQILAAQVRITMAYNLMAFNKD
jgi:hypothetical protein